MTVLKEQFNGQPVDKVCSCGEHLQFRRRSMGGLEPVCLEHGVNHFTDCPDRARYSRAKKPPETPGKQSHLEVG